MVEYQNTRTSNFQQVSEMEAFVDLKVAGGDLLEGPGSVVFSRLDLCSAHLFTRSYILCTASKHVSAPRTLDRL